MIKSSVFALLLLLTSNIGYAITSGSNITPIIQFLLSDKDKSAQTNFNAGDNRTKNSDDQPFTQAATGGQGDGAISYSSSATAVATVDSTGKVTIAGVGKTTITATKAADTNYNEASDGYILQVIDPSVDNTPTAMAGDDISTTSNSIVNLDGSASTDPDGVIVSYSWQQISGLAVSLLNRDQVSPGFVAPVISADSYLVFELTVADDGGKTATDEVQVTVSPPSVSSNTAPVVSLGVAPDRATYTIGSDISLLATVDDAEDNVVNVAFYIDGALVTTDTSLPYQFIWTGKEGSHVVKAVATDSDGLEGYETVSNLVVGDDNGNGLKVTSSLSTEAWNRLLLKVENEGDDTIDIRDAVFTFDTPSASSYTYAVSTDSTSGISWIISKSYSPFQLSSDGNPVEHWIPLPFSTATDWGPDTVLSKGDSITVRFGSFAPSLTDDVYNNSIKGSVNFYLENAVPTDFAKATVNVSSEVTGNATSPPTDSVQVYIKNPTNDDTQIVTVGWGQDLVLADLVSGVEYEIWSNVLQSEGLLYTPNHTLTTPAIVVADKDTDKDVTVSYTAASISQATISLTFSSLPLGADVDLTLVNQLSDESNASFVDLMAGESHQLLLDIGTYTLNVADYRDPVSGTYYVANAPAILPVSGDDSLVITFNSFAFGPVPGLPNYLSMGTITNGHGDLDSALTAAKIDAIYRYAGPGGNGDRGQIIDPIFTRKAIEQARAVETDERKVMPIMVVYTAEASGGAYAENDIAIYDNLVKHNINLIRIVKTLQESKDADHPKPGGIILNADFLGVLQQSGSLDNHVLWENGLWNGSAIDVNLSLREAISYVVNNDGSQRVQVPQFEDNLFGYLQMQNYIIRAYGPDVIFGWQQNLWSIGSADWAHTQRAGEEQLKSQVSDKVSEFVTRLGVYEGLWRPDFFAFDKYERDGFGPDARQSYAYNHNDWSNYLDYVKHIGLELEIPTVIWQIPGGHIPTVDEVITDFDIAAHSASAAPYLFGDSRITSIDDTRTDFQEILLSENQNRVNTIYHGHATAGEYLRESSYDWSQSQLQRVADSGIVSILWGGGSTTSVVSLGASTGYDDDWLLNKVNSYAEDRIPLSGSVLNSLPIVNAGEDQQTTSGETIYLSGYADDTDGTISSVLWSSASSEIIFSSQNTLLTSFVAPLVSTDTDFVVSFQATDNLAGTTSGSVTISVEPAPRQVQDDISVDPYGIDDEEDTNYELTVNGGSGSGSISAISRDTNVATVSVSGNKIDVSLIGTGSTNITVYKLEDVEYEASNSIDIPVAVSVTSKSEQELIATSSSDHGGEVGDTDDVVISGGSGNGTLVAASSDASVVTSSIDGNTVTLHYKRVGNATITIQKSGDSEYQSSNEIEIAVQVQASTTPSTDEFTVTPTVETGSVALIFTNISDADIDIRDAVFIVKSPVDITTTTADLAPVNNSISWPSKLISSELNGSDYLVSVTVSFDEGDWVDSVMEPDSTIIMSFWIDTTGITENDFSLVEVLLADTASVSDSVSGLMTLNDPVNLEVPGWGKCMAMGTVTQNELGINQDLADANVGAIFKYAGDGSGNQGEIVEPVVTRATIAQARSVEDLRNNDTNVMPVMVVYTAEASSGGVGENDIKNSDNLTKHFINLIYVALEMQSNRDGQHPNPGSIILNPDLFGEWLLNSYRVPNEFEYEYGKPGEYTSIQIREALQAAMVYVQEEKTTPVLSMPDAITDDILGFVQAHNYLIRGYAPDVTFGWQQNLWPMTGSAYWVLERYAGNQHLWDEVSHEAVAFLEQIGAYTGDWKPDFLVFDKYEFDEFGGGKGAYAYNNLDWLNYLLFVKQVTDAIQMPAMLWQIPGGHMPSDNDPAIKFDILTHAASGGPFFMGDKNIASDQGGNIGGVVDEVLNIELGPAVYGVSTVGEYLAEDSTYDWGQSQLRRAAFSNVFAILWGGGNTTAVVKTGGSGDDDGWLKKRVEAYYDNGCMALLSSDSVPDGGVGGDEISGNSLLDDAVTGDFQEQRFNTEALLTQLNVESSIYRWADFIQAVTQMHQQGVGKFTLWLGGEDANDSDALKARYGLVNLAAFLAQSMQETIQYDACDENNWTDTNVVQTYPQFGVTPYPMTAACGQLGQDYASYEDGSAIACPRDPKMEVSAATTATWYGAPGPLFAAPDSALEHHGLLKDGKTGRWDYLAACSVFPSPAIDPYFTVENKQAYMREECEVYKGQKGGAYVWDGKSDSKTIDGSSVDSVEGCGWWGRGVIQTTGRGNFGRLNHYLGRTHLDKSDVSLMQTYPAPVQPLYGDLDLCSNPQFVCTSSKHPELKWVAGLFYWMSSVQEYSDISGTYNGWTYIDELKQFVDDGMVSNSFIDAVSGIVNRGCPAQTCPSGVVHEAENRRDNFSKVLDIMGVKDIN